MSTEVEEDAANSPAEEREASLEASAGDVPADEAPAGDAPAIEPPAATVPAADVARGHLKGLIEALVFASEHPLTVNELAKAAGGAERKLVRVLADELRQEYSRRGIHLEEVAGGLLFRTNAAYAPFVRDVTSKKPVRMTRAQLETLAIVAYRQPLTRPEIDEIRGVDSGPVLKLLLDRDLIKILGKKDEPGRPLLYGTTPVFLEFFGLKALKDLPSLREFTELSDDSRRVFDREMGDSDDAAPADVGALAAAASSVASSYEASAHPTDPSLPTLRPAELPHGEGLAPDGEAQASDAEEQPLDAEAEAPDAEEKAIDESTDHDPPAAEPTDPDVQP